MKTLIIDYRSDEEEKNTLKSLGYNILLCPPCNYLYEAVSGHPDMLLHIIDKNNLMVHRDAPKSFVDSLSLLGFNVLFSSSSLKSKYPQDIILNAVNLPNYFIHYINHTDKSLLNLVKENKILINVKQGYTKCSIAIVNNKAVITSDKGIASALTDKGFHVLLLPPGDIELPGLNYGFIGGCCGLLEENLLAFYGSLESYKYGVEVISFLKEHKVTPIYLRKGKLIDRGSIFAI